MRACLFSLLIFCCWTCSSADNGMDRVPIVLSDNALLRLRQQINKETTIPGIPDDFIRFMKAEKPTSIVIVRQNVGGEFKTEMYVGISESYMRLLYANTEDTLKTFIELWIKGSISSVGDWRNFCKGKDADKLTKDKYGD